MSGFPPQDSSSIDATLTEPSEGVGALLGDRYRLLALLGFGQSSRVYLAEDTATGERVAVKGLRPWLSRDALFLQRFRGEATALAQLSHPNVVTVLDWGATATETYLVVEAFGGGSLGDLAGGGEKLSPSQALLVGLQAAQGLHYAHSLGWAHRDLKPTKLLFTPAGRLGIGGFGIARVVVQAPGVEAPVSDRARYRPPEEVVNDRGGRSADVYALAVILIEAVTGDVPLLGDGATMTKALRAETDLPVPEDFGSLRPALEAAGRSDPSARLTAAELVEALTVAARTLPRPRPIPVPDVDELLAQEKALAASSSDADTETIDLRDGDENRASEPSLAPDSIGDAADLTDSLQAIPIPVPPITMSWRPPSTLPVESVAPHRPIADLRPVQSFPFATGDRSTTGVHGPEGASAVVAQMEHAAVAEEPVDLESTIEPPPRRATSSLPDAERDSVDLEPDSDSDSEPDSEPDSDSDSGPNPDAAGPDSLESGVVEPCSADSDIVEPDSGAPDSEDPDSGATDSDDDALAGVARSGFGILLGEVDLRPRPNHASAPSPEVDDAVVVDLTAADEVEEGVDSWETSEQTPGAGPLTDQADGGPDPEATLEAPPSPERAGQGWDDEPSPADDAVTIEADVALPRRDNAGVFGVPSPDSGAEVVPAVDFAPMPETSLHAMAHERAIESPTRSDAGGIVVGETNRAADPLAPPDISVGPDPYEVTVAEVEPLGDAPTGSGLDQARPVRLRRLSDPTEGGATPPVSERSSASAVASGLGYGVHRMPMPERASGPDGPTRTPSPGGVNRLQVLAGLAALVVVVVIIVAVSGVGRGSQEAAPTSTTAPTVVVGSFIGQPLAEAEAAAAANGWTLVTTESFQAGAEVGEIVGQEPGGGRPLAPGGELTVAVSLGPEMVALPSIVGLPVEEATAILSEAGLPIGAITQTHDEVVPLGEVLSVRVEGKDAPDQLELGIPIDLVVSAGAQTTAMPSFVGLSRVQALAQAEEQGLVVVEEAAPSDLYDVGLVVDTQPPTGAAIRPGDTLTLVISTGASLAVIPDLAGATPAAAAERLTASGFVVGDTVGPPDQPVIATSPPAGERHALGTEVAIVTAS